MRQFTQTLQSLFFKRPYLVVFLFCALLTFPWITLNDFYTKGEPREATVATYMLNTGNWILPRDYADETAYKPPFMHWFIAAFSLPQGHVTETTARLPSALGLVGMTVLFFAFLYRRTTRSRALTATLILFSAFEIHRSGLEARVDMFLTFFMVAALINLYKWEEKGLRGYPWLIPLFLTGAALVKGPVGIVLPCLVFGIYLLLLQRYSFWKILLKNILVALPALPVLLAWYYLAYRQGGEQFLNVVYAENFGRFLGKDAAELGITYSLGHEGPFWYYIPSIILGFLPWSFVAIFALFTVSYKTAFKNASFAPGPFLRKLTALNKMTLYSIVSVMVILCFYAIPASKRSVYIMPSYPFGAYLLALLFEWVIQFRPKLIRVLGYIIAALAGLVLVLVFVFHFINLYGIVSVLTHNARTLFDIRLYSDAFMHPGALGILLWLLLLVSFVTCLRSMKSKMAKNILYSTFVVYICFQVFLEGFAFPVFKNGHSLRPFAEKIEAKYHLKHNSYVMNNLLVYPNLYELNFYLGNHFKNFEKELPAEGYFLIGSANLDKVRTAYESQYRFEELERTANKFNDFRDVIVVCKIVKL